MALPSVSAIADVLGLWGDDGWLTPPLHPVVGAPQAVIGRALPVELYAAPTGEGFAAMYDLLSDDLSGRTLVFAGAEPVQGAIWGEILTTAAARQGATAAVVEGWVRDVADLTAIGLPVYASGLRVDGPAGQVQIRAVGGAVRIADVEVGPDDHIVSDASGCVRVRGDQLDDVLAAADRYATGEALVMAALAEGEPLRTAYRHKKTVVDELRRR